MVKDRTVIWWNESEGVPVCLAVCDTREHAEIVAGAWELVWNDIIECDNDDYDNYDLLDVDFIKNFLAPFDGVELIDLEVDGIGVMTSF